MSVRKIELIESAAIGIKQYLRSTRGSNLCGANAKVEKTGNSITVIVKDDQSDSGHPVAILFTVAGE